MKVFKTILLLFICTAGFCQDKKSAYSAVDDKTLKLSAFSANNLDSLSQLLTKNFSAEEEKVRAIYVWVANNIAYDMQKYLERKNLANMILKKKDNSESAEKIFAKRKAVCEGYSNLVKALCNKAGITCELVEGIGRPLKNQYDLHAWNAVKINNEWKLLDATWSAGAIDGKKNKFEKKFDDHFFLMPAAEFIKTHYPFDPMWQLLLQPVKRTEFETAQIISADTAFHFNDTILFHFQQDSISQLLSSSRRTFQFDPENNLAETNLTSLTNYLESKKLNEANGFLNEGVQQFNDCVTITNDAKKTRSTKKMNSNEAKLRQLVKDSRSNMQKAIELYGEIKFSDNSNDFVLKQNIENTKNNLKQLNDFEKYLDNYFSTPKMMRGAAL